MSRVNKTQSYAALWLNSQGWSITKISNELDLTEKQIQNLIEKSQKTNDSNPIKTVSSPVATSPSKNLMIRETANKRNNVSIMTKESSMLNDELKKKTAPPVRNNTGIYRPNGN
jgi:hypothetical protein